MRFSILPPHLGMRNIYEAVGEGKNSEKRALKYTKGDGGDTVFSEGGGVQGRVFKDIESGFFANIHIKVQLTFFVFGGSICPPLRG